MSVDDTWDSIVVDVTTFSKDVLNSSDTFFFGLVREHLTLDGVTDSIDGWCTCLPMVIDFNLTTVVHDDSRVFEAKSTSIGVSANANENDINIELRLRVVLSVNNVQLDTLLSIVDTASGSRVKHEFDSLLLQRLCESFADFNIEEWANALSVLKDGNLSTESLVNATKLEANDATTDDSHLLRDLLEIKSSSRADNILFVELETRGCGQLVGLGASGDDNVLGRELILASIDEVNRDSSVGSELAPSLHVVDVVLLHEVFNTLGETTDGLLLALHKLREVDRDGACHDAKVLELVLGLVEFVSRVQQSFRGNAANIEAGTAESTTLLNADGFETALTSLDSGNIASWTTTDDSEVILSCSEAHARELHEAGVAESALKQAGTR